MKVFKLRFNCLSFVDVVLEAENKEEAKDLALRHVRCPQYGMEFGEFLKVEKDDKPINQFSYQGTKNL